MKKHILVSSLLALSMLTAGYGYAGAATLDNHYTMKSGDTLWIVSQKSGVSLSDLIAANPQIKDANNIAMGEILTLPEGYSIVSNETNTTSTTPTSASSTYTVVSGDTFKIIAGKLSVSLADLMNANPQMTNYDQIQIGMKINVPSNSVQAVPTPLPVLEPALPTGSYTVLQGDTLNSIAKKNGTTLSALITANPQISNFDNIMPGMVVYLPVPGTQPVVPADSAKAPSNSVTGEQSTPWEVKADAVIASGKKQLGVPYVFGGNEPGIAFDCSGFTQYAFNQNGFNLPHNAAMQSKLGTPVEKDQLRKGDLIFLEGTYTPGVSHVAIYLGNNQILQAGTLGTREVKISTLFGTPYYDQHYWGARRIIN